MCQITKYYTFEWRNHLYKTVFGGGVRHLVSTVWRLNYKHNLYEMNEQDGSSCICLSITRNSNVVCVATYSPSIIPTSTLSEWLSRYSNSVFEGTHCSYGSITAWIPNWTEVNMSHGKIRHLKCYTSLSVCRHLHVQVVSWSYSYTVFLN